MSKHEPTYIKLNGELRLYKTRKELLEGQKEESLLRIQLESKGERFLLCDAVPLMEKIMGEYDRKHGIEGMFLKPVVTKEGVTHYYFYQWNYRGEGEEQKPYHKYVGTPSKAPKAIWKNPLENLLFENENTPNRVVIRGPHILVTKTILEQLHQIDKRFNELAVVVIADSHVVNAL